MNGSTRLRQAGYTIWQWMVIVLVAGFLLTVGFSVGPLYVTNYSVQATVKSLQNEPELASKSIQEIRAAIERVRAETPDIRIMIEAHPKAKSGVIVHVRDAAYDAGYRDGVNLVLAQT